MSKAQLKAPFADLLPPLSTEEFAALRADIKENGVLHKIAVDEDGNILDGHHRYKVDPNADRTVIEGLTPAEKEAYVFRSNRVHRNSSPEQKRELLKRMKLTAKALHEQDHKKYTHQRIGEILGVARNTVSVWFGHNVNDDIMSPRIDAKVKIPVADHPELVEQLKTKTARQVAADFGVSERHVNRIHTKERKQQEVKAEREIAVASLGEDTLGIHHGDFRELGVAVEDGSIDLILTDPPYDEDAVALYGDLAEFSARVLRPGGWCLCYSGQVHLPEVIQGMQVHLTWGWQFAIIHTGGDLRFRKFKIQNKWKPVLGFYKQPLSLWWDWFPDTVSGGKEKELHEWQQAEAEARHFIDALCPANGIVVDCFVGSGTVAVAARKSGRRFLGYDIDEEAVKTARVRLNDATATG